MRGPPAQVRPTRATAHGDGRTVRLKRCAIRRTFPLLLWSGTAVHVSIGDNARQLATAPIPGKRCRTTPLVHLRIPPSPGRLIVITAAVTGHPPGTVTPTGTVTVVVKGSGGGTYTAALTGGTAVVTEHGLSVGPHEIVATYTGDAHFGGSSGTSVHTVLP